MEYSKMMLPPLTFMINSIINLMSKSHNEWEISNNILISFLQKEKKNPNF